jgi:two-component system LytT family response regulator
MTFYPLKAVIIEDEEESLQLLHNLIEATGLATVKGSTMDPGKALGLIISLEPDIVFLDIKMPVKNGFEILDDLRKAKSERPFIVFTTAYDEYSLKAFDYAAFDYLLKPVEPARLTETLLRCIESRKAGLKQQYGRIPGTIRKIVIRNISGLSVIDPKDVLYVEAEGNYSVFHLISNRIETATMLLGKVEEQLPSEMFFRISRSYVINLDYIKKINTKRLQCTLSADGAEYNCSISRSKLGDLLEKIKGR